MSPTDNVHQLANSLVMFIAVGPLAGGRLTGGELTWLELAKNLQQEGLRISVLTSKAGESNYRSYGLNADYFVIDTKANQTDAYLLFSIVRLLIRSVKGGVAARKLAGTFKAYFVTSDLLFENIPLLFLRKSKESNIVSVFHMVYSIRGHESAFSPGWKRPSVVGIVSFLQQMLSLQIMRLKCDLILAHKNTVAFLLNRGVDPSKVVPAPLAIVGPELETIVKNTPRSGFAFDAVWLGRFSSQKGITDLMKIWKRITTDKPGAKIVLFGSASVDPRTARMAHEEHVQGLTFKGFVSEAEKAKLIRQSKILLFPSHYEGLPVAVCEALACGTPVVAYDLPFNRGFSKGVVWVRPYDVVAFAQSALNLIDNSSVWNSYSNAATQEASMYKLENLVAIVKKEFERRGIMP